jgi:hypothetical protein
MKDSCKTIKGKNFLCRVAPQDIGFLTSILEWYHEVGILRTRDEEKGLIELWVSPFFEEDAKKMIEYLVKGGFVKKFEVIEEIGDNWTRR